MTQFLASVRNTEEALLAAAEGADLIDLKAPDRGSLGALPVRQIQTIVAALGGRKPVSATIGDLPLEPERVSKAVEAVCRTGVDYVKVGFFPGGNETGTIRSLRRFTARGFRLVAVLFADRDPSPDWPACLAEAGFAGCMLDTADKKHGSLTEICSLSFLHRFVDRVTEHGLLCGLAGSLRAGDIPELLAMRPDYLGFRGALCDHGNRSKVLDPERVRRIRAAISEPAATRRILAVPPDSARSADREMEVS